MKFRRVALVLLRSSHQRRQACHDQVENSHDKGLTEKTVKQGMWKYLFSGQTY